MRHRYFRPRLRPVEPRIAPASFVVSNLNDAGDGSLRDAILQANATPEADTITFTAGLTGTISLTSGPLSINRPVEILGPGADLLTIDGNKTGRVVVASGPIGTSVSLQGLTLTNGSSPSNLGGAVFSNINLTLSGVIVSNSTAKEGGGVFQTGPGVLTAKNSLFFGNTATEGNGGAVALSQLPSRPGPLQLRGGFPVLGINSSTISDSVLTDNQATGGNGGGLYVFRSSVVIERSTIRDNFANGSGGGIAGDTHFGIFLSDSSVLENSAVSGGGLSVVNSKANLTSLVNSTVSANTTATNGAGLAFSGSDFRVWNTTITNNTGGLEGDGVGGGIAAFGGNGDLQNSVLTGNFRFNFQVPQNQDLFAYDSNISAKYCLITTRVGSTFTDGDGVLLGISGKLGKLADNGGPTLTHLPDPDSLVVNAGDPLFSGLANDQRGPGFPRVVGGRIDMGSVERQAATVAQLNVSNASAVESGGGITFTVSISPNPTAAVTVDYKTVPGTATAGIDYVSKTGSLTFNPGEPLTQSVTITIINDLLDEDDETFALELFNVTGPAEIENGVGVGTILDDDEPPTVFFTNDAKVVEGTGGPGPTAFIGVQLSGPSGREVSFRVRTVDGTAIAIDDYTPLDKTFQFAPGSTSTSIFVTINPDAIDEPDEFFTLELLDLVNLRLGEPSVATVTIIDDDDPPTAAITGFVGFEGNSGTTPFPFVVSLSTVSGQVVTIEYTTADGTATVADNDYQPTSGTLTFLPGVTQQTITVLVNGDTVFEPDEEFFVLLTGGTNIDLNQPAVTKAIGRILNDDLPPVQGITVKLSASPTWIPEFLGQSTIRANLSKASAGPVTVNLAFAGTATFGEDYTVPATSITVPAGKLSGTLLLKAVHDTIHEPNETVIVSIVEAFGASPLGPPVTITIVDDDAPGTKIKTTVIDDGGDQRSKVCSITLGFDGITKVNLSDFTLEGMPASMKMNLTSKVIGVDSITTIRFSGPGVSGCCSLPDGQYTLYYKGGIVRRFHRLFGDHDGDGDVDATDLKAFLASYRYQAGDANYKAYFDYECDSVIAAGDYYNFMIRFGTVLTLLPGSD